jgi:type IV secretory pathway VirD2 relaxase
MVKVSGGARTVNGVLSHLRYIGREGDLEIETDEGQRIRTDGSEHELMHDWGLDLEQQRTRHRPGVPGRRPTKLVHNIVLSMPEGTAPDELKGAARHFAQERFGLSHRYAMVLHTDQKHPHVHLVVKAMSERGVRLNIRKDTLREWREEFAQSLRAHGVAANATERVVRGRTEIRKPDGIYRAMRRGDSVHWKRKVEQVANELFARSLRVEPGREKLWSTRKEMDRAWRTIVDVLRSQNDPELAARVVRFTETLPPARTEKEWIAHGILGRLKEQQLTREQARSR